MNALSPLGWLYGLATDLRNAFYDRGIFASHALGAKTISIGNLTTGGTGKTPLVAFVARMLADNGEKVCVLTRGYGRRNPSKRVIVSDGKEVFVDFRTGGDEPIELANRLIGKAMVIADRDRVLAAAFSREKFGSTAFVLDDGFQHRRAKRDIDIVCVDATSPFGNGEILPAGSLRERQSNLNRADIVIITRADLVKNVDDLKGEIQELAPNTAIFTSSTAFSGFHHLDDSTAFRITDMSQTFAFCALGNPSAFFDQLKNEGVSLVGERSFRDHYPYTQQDLDALTDDATDKGAKVLVTTAKDAARLKGIDLKMDCIVAEIDVRIENEKRFRDLISS
jgi:tetraacyldisaccharide 4'-kinase